MSCPVRDPASGAPTLGCGVVGVDGADAGVADAAQIGGEDVAELTLHGGPWLVGEAIRVLTSLGADQGLDLLGHPVKILGQIGDLIPPPAEQRPYPGIEAPLGHRPQRFDFKREGS